MGFPGTWMTESESMVYRVFENAPCSTIGQIMFYSDHGRFFGDDIHDSTAEPAQMGASGQPGPDRSHVRAQIAFTFTCIRNPYTRILSSFFDKIWHQRNEAVSPASWCRCWSRNTGSR